MRNWLWKGFFKAG